MFATLPSWLERLLGTPAVDGEGTAWSLDHSWSWRPSITLGFAIVAAIFVIATYLRENRHATLGYRMALAALRLCAVAVVLLMLAQFVLLLRKTGLPYLAVVVDDSLSMTIVDRYEQKDAKSLSERVQNASFKGLSRWNLARACSASGMGRCFATSKRTIAYGCTT